MSSTLNDGAAASGSSSKPDPAAARVSPQPGAAQASFQQSKQQRRRKKINPKIRPGAASVNSRVFRLPGGLMFSCLHSRLLDVLLDWVQTFFEGVVLLLGPILILLALGITAVLTYSFFHIILPMMFEKHQSSFYWKWICIGLHCVFVVFLVVNVLFNYYMCVVTRNTGPHYDRVVRELATATGFTFPETPAEVETYRQEYEDKMVIRIQRRRERETEKLQLQQQQQAHNDESNNDVEAGAAGNDSLLIHRKPPARAAAAKNPPATSTNVRRWMIMGPYEWGFCHNSQQPKPPRSHYDHVTKRLVLNLDHYCPWVFNSIGYFNYRYFVNFLIFVFCGMAYGAVLAWEPFWLLSTPEFRKFNQQERRIGGHLPRPSPMFPHRDERMLLSLGFMLCAAVGFAILLLGGFHLFLVFTAQTTIEFHGNWNKWRNHVLGVAGGKFRNPYSEGWRKNWKRIYGDRHWFLALLPNAREPEYLPVPVPGRDTKRHFANSSSTSTAQLLKEPPEDPPAGDNV